MLPRLGSISRLLSATEHPHDAALRSQFDDHIGALVDGPDVVFPVDAHAMSKRPPVQLFRNLSYVFALRAEFQQLCGGWPVGRTIGTIRTREHEDVTLRIDSHTCDLAKIHAVGQLEEI